MAAPTKPCPSCAGRGVVPRLRRMIGEGAERKPDPLDFQAEECCSPCGGSGVVADLPKGKLPTERKPGFVADQIGVAAFWES